MSLVILENKLKLYINSSVSFKLIQPHKIFFVILKLLSLNSLMQKEETMWKQRSRVNWLAEEDKKQVFPPNCYR